MLIRSLVLLAAGVTAAAAGAVHRQQQPSGGDEQWRRHGAVGGSVVVDIGDNIGRVAAHRLLHHLRPWAHTASDSRAHQHVVKVLVETAEAAPATAGDAHGVGGTDQSQELQQHEDEQQPVFLFTVGNTAATRRLIDADTLAAAGPEGFVVRCLHHNGVVVVAANGNPLPASVPRSQLSSLPSHTLASTGAISGAYAALEELGFAFFHPLQPLPPHAPAIPSQLGVRTERPRWRHRGFHVHTQHPLELTDVLQGFDIMDDVPAAARVRRLAAAPPPSPQAVAAATGGGGWLRASVLSVLAWVGAEQWAKGDSAAPGGVAPAAAPLAADQQVDAAAAAAAEGRSLAQHATAAASAAATNSTHDHSSHHHPDASTAESWESMLGDVQSFFEWCAANRVNKVQWLLLTDPAALAATPEAAAARSDLRQSRLSRLVALAHSFGLLAGVDVPLGLQQQHAWYMVRPRQGAAEQQRRIRERCDWVAAAGFDFISTESGLSEFTHPGDALMLSLMDTFATHVNGTLNLPASIKVHCSQGQTSTNFADPRGPETGPHTPLNFNFLPTYAVPGLGVMPHSVQAYGLDDFAANVYGNPTFEEMKEYMFYEARKGERSVVYYGETAYWVAVDVDVPLFLPLYGERRLHDLRLIAREEAAQGFSIDGQMNFDSGWEWGYWLNDVITARAAWDPHMEADSDAEALQALLEPVVSRAVGANAAAALTSWLTRFTAAQHTLLIQGSHGTATMEGGAGEGGAGADGQLCGGGDKPHELVTGFAYLSGRDTWFELPNAAGIDATQPDRVLGHEWEHAQYACVAPLLRAMEDEFAGFADELRAIAQEHSKPPHGAVGSAVLPLVLAELQDGVDMLLLRARHARLLHKAQAPTTTRAHAAALLVQGRGVIGKAADIVAHRESAYRVPLTRIASWRESGPTVYRFGYLWAVHSLYYWWRDQGRAEQTVLRSRTGPCYLNRMDPTEVAFGWGRQTFQAVRVALAAALPLHGDFLLNCLAPPPTQYAFPRDLHRYSLTTAGLFRR